VRKITTALERSRCRDDFEIMVRWATRPDDLQRSLLDHEPDVVHFSGHGSGVDGIALESNAGKSQVVSLAALAKLFGAFKDKIRCVVLNAWYSEVQAEAIHAQIETVIGMKRAIGALLRRYRKGRAALEFAVGFYSMNAILSGTAPIYSIETFLPLVKNNI
jgi:hypothetical protein